VVRGAQMTAAPARLNIRAAARSGSSLWCPRAALRSFPVGARCRPTHATRRPASVLGSRSGTAARGRADRRGRDAQRPHQPEGGDHTSQKRAITALGRTRSRATPAMISMIWSMRSSPTLTPGQTGSICAGSAGGSATRARQPPSRGPARHSTHGPRPSPAHRRT